MQDTYHSNYNDLLSKNSVLKDLFVKYNEKLRHFDKKNHKLKQNLESVHVKSGITYCHREENEEFKDIMRVTKKEIEEERNVMKIKYNENDLEKLERENQNRMSKFNSNITKCSCSRKVVFAENFRRNL